MFWTFFAFASLCRYFISPVQWKHYSSPLSYLCSHIPDLTIPDRFISLCNNKSILHHLDYLIFPLCFSEQILHQKCISPQGKVLMAVLTGPNTYIYQQFKLCFPVYRIQDRHPVLQWLLSVVLSQCVYWVFSRKSKEFLLQATSTAQGSHSDFKLGIYVSEE